MWDDDIDETMLFDKGMYYGLLKAWDDMYRSKKLTMRQVQAFNQAVQAAYDCKQISKQDTLHFAALICYLQPQE